MIRTIKAFKTIYLHCIKFNQNRQLRETVALVLARDINLHIQDQKQHCRRLGNHEHCATENVKRFRVFRKIVVTVNGA